MTQKCLSQRGGTGGGRRREGGGEAATAAEEEERAKKEGGRKARQQLYVLRLPASANERSRLGRFGVRMPLRRIPVPHTLSSPHTAKQAPTPHHTRDGRRLLSFSPFLSFLCAHSTYRDSLSLSPPIIFG